jgi:uncharacterized protein (UPF0297 family)
LTPTGNCRDAGSAPAATAASVNRGSRPEPGRNGFVQATERDRYEVFEVNEMGDPSENTRRFDPKDENFTEVSLILQEVCAALKEKGYDPLDQIVGYLLSGDPAYITSFRNARVLIKRLERDQILEELVRSYLEKQGIG